MPNKRRPRPLNSSCPCLRGRGAVRAGPRDTTRHRIQLRTLGEVSVLDLDGREIESLDVQPKRVALLVYLAVAAPDRFQRRDTLLAMFWPERDETHARAALRQALHGLRQELGEHTLTARGDDEVGVDPKRLWCDAVDFEEALRDSDLPRAVRLSAGPFLEGFHVKDVPEYDQWAQTKRDKLERGYATALEGIAEREAAQGHTLCAVEWWRQLTELEPYSSRIAVRFMEALVAVGERAEAIRYATRHAGLLRQAFNADADPSVQALADLLRNQKTGAYR